MVKAFGIEKVNTMLNCIRIVIFFFYHDIIDGYVLELLRFSFFRKVQKNFTLVKVLGTVAIKRNFDVPDLHFFFSYEYHRYSFVEIDRKK